MPWAKAGIIITGSTRPGSAYAAMMVTGSHGVRMQYDYTSDVAGLPGSVSAASPRWLRLARSGDVVTGYDSADGRHWTEVAVVHLAGLAGTVRAGMFATSPLDFTPNFPTYAEPGGSLSASVATGAFDDVGLRGGAPGGQWAGQNVGTIGADYDGPRIGLRQAGGQFTVTGSGDIGPVVAAGVKQHIHHRHPRRPSVRGVHRAAHHDRHRGHVHHRGVPARSHPHHAGRQPAARPDAGRQGGGDRPGDVRARVGRRGGGRHRRQPDRA